MTLLIDWSKFIPALLLLLTPIALFHGQQVRYRALPQDWSAYWRQTLSLGLHSIDFGRALLGAWYLTVALSPPPDAIGLPQHYPLLVSVAVLALATVLQSFICRESDSANAPFAFSSGLVLGFLPLHFAGFALITAMVVATGLRAPAVFFPTLGGAVIIAGFLFDHGNISLPVLFVAVAVTLPWLLVLLYPRQWVVTHRLKREDASSPRDTSVLR